MALPIPIVVDNFADYYSEQKKIEAKELKKEAQAKQVCQSSSISQVSTRYFVCQAEFDVDAEAVANQGLIKTLCNTPGPFIDPPMSPNDGFQRQTRQNGTINNKF